MHCHRSRPDGDDRPNLSPPDAALPRRNFRDDVLVFPDGSRLALPADDVFFQTLVSGRLDRKTAEVIRQSLHRGAVGMRSAAQVDGRREVREIRPQDIDAAPDLALA